MLKGRQPRSDHLIPGGGEFVLGQASRDHKSEHYFDPDKAFLGEMAHVNIWHHVMSSRDIRNLYGDCELMKCGDAVEWADFRSGTRGDMRIRWPALIHGTI